MSRPASPTHAEPPARRFSREIADAVAAGTNVEELVLHLTLMDASKVKRDPGVPLEHVSFSPEGMRFLGVRVVQGGVLSSTLSSGEISVVEAPVAAPKAKARAKKTAAAAKPR